MKSVVYVTSTGVFIGYGTPQDYPERNDLSMTEVADIYMLPVKWNPVEHTFENESDTEDLMSPVEFMFRFTQAERVAIHQLSDTDFTIIDFLFLLDHTLTVNIDDAFVVNAISYLVSVNVLTEERKQHILGI